MGKMKELDYNKWLEKGNKKFGRIENWKFKCPKCGNIATVAEFEELGKSANTATQNCIGRFTKEKGCDWTAYGLLGTLDKGISVKNVDGSTIQVFDFGD